MVDGKGDRLPETRDRNLSGIVSRIRDDGPAALGHEARACAGTADNDFGSGYDTGAVPQLLREAEPPGPSRPDPPATPWSSAPGAMPTPPPEPPSAKWRPASLFAVAVLTAMLLTGGVIAALYRDPIETALRRPEAPNGDSALRQEIAAVQTSIEMLSERVESITGEGTAPETIAPGAPPEPATVQMADTVSDARGADALEVRLDKLAHRLDSMAEQVVRLISETERPQVGVPADPASPEQAGAGPAAASAPARIASDRAAESVGRPVPPGPLTGAPAPIVAGVPPAQPAKPHVAADLSVKPTVPIAIVHPNPGAVGAPAMSEAQAEPPFPARSAAPAAAVAASGTGGDRPVAQSNEDRASLSPEPAEPLPAAAQKNLQRLAAILEQEVTILADAARAPGASGVETFAEPVPAAPHVPPYTPLTGSGTERLGSRNASAVFAVPGAEAVAEPEAAPPPATGPNALPVASGEEWFINLVAVRREASALDLQRTYRDKGIEAQVVPLGRGLFGVRVGGFDSRRDAEARAGAIKTALGIREVWIARR